MRGRNGRKGPNPLTRSYESNGPDVKIRGTAQHVAEKYLQLARDAQSSGDTIMAESLLQHAEHYFRLIAAAQQQVNGYARPQYEAEVETSEDDDDFAALPDRFAPLSERLPAPAYQPQPQQQPFAPPQPHFAAPQPQPQPFEERPIGDMQRPERPERPQRSERPERQAFGRDRNAEGGDRPRHQGYDRSRDRRFQPRAEAGAAEGGAGAALPSFITAPAASRPVPSEGAEPSVERENAPRDHEGGVNYHLSSRRRRRPRPPMDDVASGSREDDAPEVGELPLEPDRF
jgi:hypothetical protein